MCSQTWDNGQRGSGGQPLLGTWGAGGAGAHTTRRQGARGMQGAQAETYGGSGWGGRWRWTQQASTQAASG